MFEINEYEQIVKKHRESLYKYCYHRLGENEILVNETVDDIFYVLYKKWNKLDRNCNIRAYLYRVADNCIRHNLYKYNKYYIFNRSLEELEENRSFLDMAYYDEYFQDRDINGKKYIDRIKESLPKEFQDIFVYRYIQKKTLNDIVSLTGIPYSSLRLRLNKIEGLIQKEIKKIF